MKTTFGLGATLLLFVTGVFAQAQSTLQFVTATHKVAEGAGAIELIVERTGDSGAPVSVEVGTQDGTAIAGVKYVAVHTTLAFASGETRRSFSVTLLNDALPGATKTFKAILENPAGGTVLGARSSATVSISDNDVGVSFTLANYTVAENAGEAVVGVVRGDDANLPVTVDLFSSNLSAAAGIDYIGVTNTLSFGATERFKLVTIPILNNARSDPRRTFRLTLKSPTHAALGTQKTSTILIADNDQGFQFNTDRLSVSEDAGAVLVDVSRGTDATDLEATVDLSATDVTATNGVDYLLAGGTVSFAPGERTRRIFVSIVNNGSKQVTRTFRLNLTNASAGSTLGPVTAANVSILDNDPGAGFELGAYSVWRGAGQLSLTVLRGNDGILGPLTLDYSTIDGTAKAGLDYQATSGVLQFQEGETLGSLTIPILPNDTVGLAKTFQVQLAHPTGGGLLGLATATVRIKEASFTITPPSNSGLSVHREAVFNILSWEGTGRLQRADRVDGPWQTLAATSPCAVDPPLVSSFFRIAPTRPTNLQVPSSHDGHTPLPLVILLHGMGWSGQRVEDYMNLSPLAESRGFLYAYPDALTTPTGLFWNCYFSDAATAGTVNLHNANDVAYLRDLIAEIDRQFPVDRKRIHVIGHSNGGAMAYRMSTESSDLIASMASLAGGVALDYGIQAPSEAVNFLHIHGTADAEVDYEGGAWTSPWNTFPYASVRRNIGDWAGYNRALDPATEANPSMDLDLDVAGNETVVTRYTRTNPGGAVELWTMIGSGHVPTLSSEFSRQVIDWVLAHPKP